MQVIPAWELMFGMIISKPLQTAGVAKGAQRSDLQICRAQFVGKRRVKAARSFWVDKMLRDAEKFVTCCDEQQCTKPSGSDLILFTGEVVKSLPTETVKNMSSLMVGTCGLVSLQNLVSKAQAAQVHGTSGLLQKLQSLVAWTNSLIRTKCQRLPIVAIR